MLYYLEKGGFEVNTPLSEWYEQYQKNSAIQGVVWEKFLDPRSMTYAAYVKRQNHREIFLDTIFKHIDETRYDEERNQTWVNALSQTIGPLRFLWHGFQMIASYLGSMAPEGRLVITFAFQTMDEMSRIQRIAYRMRQLQYTYPNFGVSSLTEWQTSPTWQPLRKGLEHLLITFDWMEGFIALNGLFKPILDRLILVHYSELAKQQGD